MFMFGKFGGKAAAEKDATPSSSPNFEETKGMSPSKTQKGPAQAKGGRTLNVGSGKAAIKSGSGKLKQRVVSPPRQMLPQESPSNMGWLGDKLSKEMLSEKSNKAYTPLEGIVASYEALLWEPSKPLSCMPHQSLKTNSWKQMLRNPYTRVFALDFERAKKCEPQFKEQWAPNFECMSWEPSKPLSCMPHQSLKTNRWKQMLRNPYTRVFALDFVFASKQEERWELSEYSELPNPDCMKWEPSKPLSCMPHQSLKTNSWKQMLRNPYTRVFALDYERAKKCEPQFTVKWDAPNFECMSWEPSKPLSCMPHQSLKTNSWKQMLRNPYTRVFALDYVFASKQEERWELSEYSELPNPDCMKWEPSKPLSCFPHQSDKTNSWKQILRNPYSRVYALNYEAAKRGEPRWTALANPEWDCYDALSWEPSKKLSSFPHQSNKTNSWKKQLTNPYIRVFANDFERAKSGEPRWK